MNKWLCSKTLLLLLLFAVPASSYEPLPAGWVCEYYTRSTNDNPARVMQVFEALPEYDMIDFCDFPPSGIGVGVVGPVKRVGQTAFRERFERVHLKKYASKGEIRKAIFAHNTTRPVVHLFCKSGTDCSFENTSEFVVSEGLRPERFELFYREWHYVRPAFRTYYPAQEGPLRRMMKAVESGAEMQLVYVGISFGGVDNPLVEFNVPGHGRWSMLISDYFGEQETDELFQEE